MLGNRPHKVKEAVLRTKILLKALKKCLDEYFLRFLIPIYEIF